jgi:hypothetical protein
MTQTTSARRTPTVQQINEQQHKDAERDRQQKAQALTARPPVSTAVAAPDNRTPVQKYLDDVAPASIVGRPIRASKEHVFATPDDGEPVSDDVDFTALCDQTMVGLIRFNGEGSPPDQLMGLLYDGFQMPDRNALGDLDPSKWELGLDGRIRGATLSIWCCRTATPPSCSPIRQAALPGGAQSGICCGTTTACRRRIPTCIRWCV